MCHVLQDEVYTEHLYDTKVKRLKDRAALLKKVRDFFELRGVLEVDCPILSAYAAVDAHIDLLTANYCEKEIYYMHSSPEYGMKRLIAEGIGDIYQLSHVFRDGELSHKHNPEFTMAEWYRIGFTFEQMMEETVDFIRLFLGQYPSRIVSYRELFLQKTGIDYVLSSEEELFAYIQSHSIPYYPGVVQEGRDALLNLILGIVIEPELGKDELTVLAYYPSSQAALARRRWHGQEEVAERFEVYFQGIELANGYHELADAVEQRLRFGESNQQRAALGKHTLPLDEFFLQALEKGLPDCCGVAVGFDRLVMIRQGQHDIAESIAWGWKLA